VSDPQPMRPVRVGRRIVDLETGAFTDGGRLRPMELGLLVHLIGAGGRVVPVDELLREVWGYSDRARTRTVFSTVHRLRAAVEEDPAAPRHLLSGSGGYRWRAEAPASAIPAPGGPLFGRDALVAAVTELVAEPGRLCTVTGAPGIGKTRVVLAVARTLAQRAETWLVDLDGARTAADVLAAVAGAIGCPPDPMSVPVALASRGDALIALDEAEGAVDPLRALVPAWLAAAPGLRVLVGSRVALQDPAERVFEVPALPPDEARAMLLARSPRIEGADAAIDGLVEALEGVPLAIELAASRARSLSAAALTARMGDRLALLAGGRGRHGSLEAALAVSWGLCDAAGRRAWAAASVFPGPFDLAAAEAVLGGWDALGALVDHHLLWFDPARDRYGMLASVRAYAASRAELAVLDEAERRYCGHYAPLGPEAGEHWLVALQRSEARGDVDTVEQALQARGYRHVPDERAIDALLERVVAMPGLRDRGLALALLGAQRYDAGRAEAADEALDEALAEIRDPTLRAAVLGTRALVWTQLGRADDALALAREAEAVAPDGPARLKARYRVGNVLRLGGRYDQALAAMIALQPEVRELGDVHLEVAVASDLGTMAMWSDPPLARREIARGLRLCVEHRLSAMEVSFRLLRAKQLALDGAFDPAREAVAEAVALARRIGATRSVWEGLRLGATHEMRAGCLDRAQQLASALLAAAPAGTWHHRRGLELLADGHLVRGEVALAEAYVARLEADGARDAHTCLRRAIVLRLRGRLEEADAQLHAAAVPGGEGLGPLPLGVTLELAEIRLQQGRLQEAHNHLARAAALCRPGEPDDVGLCAALAARVEAGMGRSERAKRELARAERLLGGRAAGELHAAVAAARLACERV
jgi:tetratricopeptide (TPR) repeat protein